MSRIQKIKRHDHSEMNSSRRRIVGWEIQRALFRLRRRVSGAIWKEDLRREGDQQKWLSRKPQASPTGFPCFAWFLDFYKTTTPTKPSWQVSLWGHPCLQGKKQRHRTILSCRHCHWRDGIQSDQRWLYSFRWWRCQTGVCISNFLMVNCIIGVFVCLAGQF